jgi:hypothetical protein
VGAGGASSVGASPSGKVDARLYELDARFTPAKAARLDLTFGQAWIDDPRDPFDRQLTWFSVQPLYQLSARLHAALRYSEIGTYDADEGYRIDGEFLAGGEEAFGYDVRRLQRLSLGLGWKPNPRTCVKVEAGNDWFATIDASPFEPGNDRESFVVELAVSF